MSYCEDFPCCGHEAGCCPDYDENGRQMNMVCTCGAKLPITSRFSICATCLGRGNEDEYYDRDSPEDWEGGEDEDEIDEEAEEAEFDENFESDYGESD